MKWFISSLLLLTMITGCAKTANLDDVAFAQSTYTALANGDTTVESKIDFDSLKMMGMEVGPIYSKMPNDTEKAAFRTSFITSFSRSFKATGATAEMMKNWRVQSSTPPTAVVAVDGKKGSLYIMVTQKDGAQKMSGISLTP